MRVDVTRV